jgi:hypothetical protein
MSILKRPQYYRAETTYDIRRYVRDDGGKLILDVKASMDAGRAIKRFRLLGLEELEVELLLQEEARDPRNRDYLDWLQRSGNREDHLSYRPPGGARWYLTEKERKKETETAEERQAANEFMGLEARVLT